MNFSSAGKGDDKPSKQGNRRLQGTIYFLAVQMIQLSSKGTARNPALYYKDVYGIDDEIYRLCQDIHNYFKDKSYSEIINIIGSIPIIAPKELLENGKYKEVKHCSVSYGFADVNLYIDYEEYVEASMDEKKILIVKNVVDSVKTIKTKGKIDFNRFKEDMISFCEMSGVNYF